MPEDLFGSSKELTRAEKMKISRKATTEFSREVINWLNNSGAFKAWRNNNIPSTRHSIERVIIPSFDKDGNAIEIVTEHVKVNFKKNQKTVSTLDLIGYRISDGKHLEIEIKTGKDKLDLDQQSHLNDLQAAGCISFATGDMHTFRQQIKPYLTDKPLAF